MVPISKTLALCLTDLSSNAACGFAGCGTLGKALLWIQSPHMHSKGSSHCGVLLCGFDDTHLQSSRREPATSRCLKRVTFFPLLLWVASLGH